MIKIAVTGPESTGKTTLAEDLAAYFNEKWVPEFAREYLTNLSRPYTEDDLLVIARGQLNLEKSAALQGPAILICDTDMLVMKIWSEFRFGRVHPFIQQNWIHSGFDLYLLCGTDIPWEEDPLREHPEQRDELYELYKTELLKAKKPFVELSGDFSGRLQKALDEINKLKP